jgi:dipeptidyl aminopeptidase/acylaminoacyl peptidase
MNRRALLCCLLVLLVPALGFGEGKRSMTVVDLFRFKRVADPQISPDGKLVAYTVTTVDLAGNKSSSSIWTAPTGPAGEPRQLTNTTKKDRNPHWSPDGKQILFESTRTGESQLWSIDLAGGEARQVTNLSTEASNPTWSPDGKSIAFVSAVYPENSDKSFKESDAANKKRKEEIEKGHVKAKVFTRLFFRHWDSYVEDKRQHLFVIPAPTLASPIPEPRDVTPGDRDAYPTSTTFSSSVDFVFSPDSQYLVYTAPPERDEAWSTNYELLRVPVAGGKPETLSTGNKAADGGPVFSPDGKHLAFRAQRKAGYEADKWELMVVAVELDGTWQGKPHSLTHSLDRSVDDYVWTSPTTLLFTVEDNARSKLMTVTLHSAPADADLGVEGGTFRWLSHTAGITALSRAALVNPPEVYVSHDGKARNVSQANTALLAELKLPVPKSVSVKVEGADMQMWVLQPPGFDASKKWPLVYLVHGGPQGAWEDGWSFRWNPEVWAAQGYVVALPNPRGSTGFGQKFVDEISGDWGGKCYADLMKGMDYLEKLPYIDKDRMAAAGGSFGGYMMNWFAVSTDRFKTLITHCSVWDFDSMYATTDELWFDEWEHGGPPWGVKREAYEKHSPHRLAANIAKFKTPMLIIHNDLDFRCPIGQGHELFSTLQRLHVPARFVNFPDEGHWVLKPANSEYWHKEVFAWLKKYVKPGGE